MGRNEYFVRKGRPVYLADQPKMIAVDGIPICQHESPPRPFRTLMAAIWDPILTKQDPATNIPRR